MILSCYKHDNLNSDIFRFYNMWISADSFYSLVQANWDKPVQGCTMFRVVQRLKWLKTDLKQLNREGFSRIWGSTLSLLRLNLDYMLILVILPWLMRRNKLLCLIQQLTTSFLQQTVKIQLLELGDENSILFHLSVKHRSKHNKIHLIQAVNGEWIKSANWVQQVSHSSMVILLAAKWKTGCNHG